MELNKSDYNKLQAKLTKLKAIDKTALATEIGKGALNIQRDMKRTAPVDTGKLVDNIKAVVNNKQAEIRSDAKLFCSCRVWRRHTKPKEKRKGCNSIFLSSCK
jgi:hypothetical protein